MSVRAKFYVQEVIKRGGPGGEVRLGAATRGARNTEWSQATPSGSMTMQINNPPAFEFFEQLLARNAEFGHYPEVDIEIAVSADNGRDHEFQASPDGHYNAGRCVACGASEEGHRATA